MLYQLEIILLKKFVNISKKKNTSYFPKVFNLMFLGFFFPADLCNL